MPRRDLHSGRGVLKRALLVRFPGPLAVVDERRHISPRITEGFRLGPNSPLPNGSIKSFDCVATSKARPHDSSESGTFREVWIDCTHKNPLSWVTLRRISQVSSVSYVRNEDVYAIPVWSVWDWRRPHNMQKWHIHSAITVLLSRHAFL